MARSLAQIIYTSGTESLPKGAMLTHEAVIWEYVSCMVEGEIAEGDRLLHALPLYHCAQLDVFLGPAIYVGRTNVITGKPTAGQHPPAARAAPDQLVLRAAVDLDCAAALAAFRYHRPASACARATTARRSCRWRCCSEIQRRLPALRLWNFYGQTEIAPLATVLKPEEQLQQSGLGGARRAQRRDASR